LFKCKTYVSTLNGKNQALFQSFQKRRKRDARMSLFSIRSPLFCRSFPVFDPF
jgi:hypothetical protein